MNSPLPDDLGNLFLDLVESSPELFWRIDNQGKYRYLNPAWEKILGYRVDEMLGRTFFEFQPPEIAARDASVMAERMSSEYLFQYETILLHKDGRPLNLAFSGKLFYGKDGQAGGMQGVGYDITAHKQNEARLKSSADQLQTLISNAPTAIAMLDKDLRYIVCSNRWLIDYGLQGQNLVGRHHYEVFPSIRENDFWKDVHLRALQGETIHQDEDTFLGADGRREWLRWDVRPWLTPAGDIGGIIMLTESITARRMAEEKLRASEERYRQLSDSAFEGVLIHHKGHVLDMNKAFHTMLGYADKSELVGVDSLTTFIAPRSREHIRDRISRRDSSTSEVYCLRKDGTEILCATQSRPLEYHGLSARLVTMSDISQQKKAEQALAAEKERLSVTLHSIGDGVIATDTQGKVIIINSVASKLTGWSPSEAEGKGLSEVFQIIHEISRMPCENPVDKVLATGEIIELANHTVLIHRDGTERIIADSGAPIRDSEGKTIGVVLVFRDMTEKQRLIEAAQRTQKLESLGILAGGIAHDFNNLLSGIYGYIDILQAKSKEAWIADYLSKAMATIERARGLTHQLLTFAKGGKPIRKIASLFPFVEETVHFALSGTSIVGHFQIADDLPLCEFDMNQIGQVIDNLVINAKQAMQEDGTLILKAYRLHLVEGQVEGLPEADYVCISIGDTGGGIPADILPKIFDPFFTTKPKGSGLGLATCHSILSQHDGSIEAFSEPGKGSEFRLYLPASTDLVKTSGTETKRNFRGKGRIILMDDDVLICDTVGEMLSLSGYAVTTFQSGQGVIDFLSQPSEKTREVVAVILDLTVPGGMGGKAAVGEIRKITADLPIFVSSGYSDDPLMAEPEAFGATASIGKPFRRLALLELLHTHLGGAEE